MKENLRKLIHISDDPEFCWSLSFKPELISSTCYLGFIPMATQQFGDYILLLKMHKQRCILEFENLHIPKTARKRARKFNITIDQAFEQFWNLYDKKVGKDRSIKAFKKLNQSEVSEMMAFIPKYKQAQPDKQFRKNPEAFINNKGWLDELISKTPEKKKPANNAHLFRS